MYDLTGKDDLLQDEMTGFFVGLLASAFFGAQFLCSALWYSHPSRLARFFRTHSA